MLDERPSLFTRLLRGLDGLRRFLVNVLFFGLLAGLVIASLGGRPKVPDGAALVLNPRGTIVEQLAPVDPLERLVAPQHRRGRHGQRDAAQGPRGRAAAREGRRAHQGRLPRHERDGGRRLHQAARAAGRDRRLPQERQEGDRLRRRLPAVAVLPGGAGRRGVPAPRGHGADRGLRRPLQLLQGRPRPLRHRDARLPRRRVQVGRRALPAQRHVARSRARCRSTPSATCGATGSRTWPRPARSRPRRSRRSSRRCPTACARRAATWRSSRSRRSSSTRSRRATRCASA